MTAVFIHGVPETPEVWAKVIGHLDRSDVTTLHLPGFGRARPSGFGATMDEYAAWVISELEKIGEPVDLVGHDWGGGFVVRVVSTRPGLVRSWVTDAAGIGDVNFEWHDFAKIWQTPGEGEEFWKSQLALPVADRGAVFEMAGVGHDDAVDLAGHVDETMAQCILDLYRSATNVGKEWGPDFHDIPAPGLVVVPSEDPFLSADSARMAAERAGARVASLEGLGHWWMLQDPARGAATIQEFWASI